MHASFILLVILVVCSEFLFKKFNSLVSFAIHCDNESSLGTIGKFKINGGTEKLLGAFQYFRRGGIILMKHLKPQQVRWQLEQLLLDW